MTIPQFPQYPQNPNLQPKTKTGYRPFGMNTQFQPTKTHINSSLFTQQDKTTNYKVGPSKEQVKSTLYGVAGSTVKKLGSKSKSSPNYLKQTYDFVNDLKTKYDNSVKGEGFRNLNGNSTVDVLYQIKDGADGADSFINKSHGGRQALAKLDGKMNSSKFANNYNKLRSPLSKTYHATKDKVATIKGKFKAPFKSIQGKITAGTKYLKGKATSGFKLVKGFVKSSKSTAALKSASSSTKTLSILGKMKNLKLVKRAGKLLNRGNAFVRLVSSGAKTSSKWVKGLRYTKSGIKVLSSGAKVAGRACWVVAIGINCYEVYDAFKKGGVKAAAPKAIQCATETACAWGGAKIGAAIGSAFGPIGTLVGGVVGGLAGYFIGSKAGKYVVAGAKKFCKAVGNGVKKAWTAGKKVVGKAIDTGKKLIKGAINTGKKVINGAKNVAKKAWNSAKSFVKSLKFW